eukprot:m.67165 g.67165  ORF g.67165 m.67165 type:complete len:97 (-) comp8208_c0_seq1:962-1252(-)
MKNNLITTYLIALDIQLSQSVHFCFFFADFGVPACAGFAFFVDFGVEATAFFPFLVDFGVVGVASAVTFTGVWFFFASLVDLGVEGALFAWELLVS